MPKRRLRHLLLSAILILSFPVAALADTIQGDVAGTGRNALDVTVYDSQGHPYPNTLRLKIDKGTRLNGFSSIGMLRKRDAIRAEVRQEKAGLWRADSVDLLQNTTSALRPASPPSASLMDALKSPTGQNVIRGSLTGALTGAVASGASGGKAGKGALIGAGVGALGGFLSGLFNQPSSGNSQASIADQQDSRR